MTLKTEFVLSAKDETKAAFTSVNQSLSKLSFGAESLTTAFQGIAAGISISAFAASIKASIDSLDKFDEAAERIGMTTEALSALTYAGKLSGLEFEDTTGALAKLSAKMQDAASGGKEAAALFGDIGVKVKDSNGSLKSADKVIAEIADRFASFEDGAAKTALAMDLFGKSGAKMVPLLNGGAEGMEKMRKEAESLGGIIDGKLAKQAAQFNDNLDRLGTLTSAAGKSIASSLLPALNQVAESFLVAQKHSDGFWESLSFKMPGLQSVNIVGELNAARNQLERLEKDRARFIANGNKLDDSKIDQMIAATRRKLEYYKELQRNEALALAEGVYGNEGRGKIKDAGKEVIRRTITAEPKGSAGSKATDPAASLIATLDKQIAVRALDLASTEKLTAAEKEAAEVMAQLDNGTIKATASQRALIEGKLQFLISADREIDAQNKYKEALAKADEQMVTHRSKMLDSIAAAERQAEVYGLTESQISVIEQARLSDAIAMAIQNGASEEQIAFLQEELRLRAELTDALIKVDKKKSEQSQDAADQNNEFFKQSARSMQSAMADYFYDPFAESADKMAAKFGDAIRRMIADAGAAQLGKLLFGNMAGGAGQGPADSGLVGAAASWLGSINWASLFAFEQGGVMTAAGPLPLRKYAMGGIANSPQLAMFGEGAQPEAYVPLPDGRNIPVKMAGQGGMTINQTIYAGDNTDSAQVRRSAASGARSVLGLMSGAQRYA